jgi:hypothetical protein
MSAGRKETAWVERAEGREERDERRDERLTHAHQTNVII